MGKLYPNSDTPPSMFDQRTRAASEPGQWINWLQELFMEQYLGHSDVKPYIYLPETIDMNADTDTNMAIFIRYKRGMDHL